MKFLARFVDERFLMHRLRSSSAAGIASGLLSIGVFEYRLFTEHLWDRLVLAIPLTFVIVKLSLMAWYYLTD